MFLYCESTCFVLSVDVCSFFSTEGDSPGENARQCKPAGLSRLLSGVPEQAESQQLCQRFRRPQR